MLPEEERQRETRHNGGAKGGAAHEKAGRVFMGEAFVWRLL